MSRSTVGTNTGRIRALSKWAGIAVGAVLGAALLALLVVVVWEDATAVSVQFVNDTGVAVTLSDCSTDFAAIAAGQTATLQVASDHPKECAVVDTTHKGGKVIGCVTMPSPLHSGAIIRLSKTHRC